MASTSRAQRIGIWVIAIALTAGTLLGFFTMILASENQASVEQAYQAYQTELQSYYEKTQEQQAELEARGAALSKKYYDKVNRYEDRVTKFNADDVKDVKVKTLNKGNGKTITDDTTYIAYYIGWNQKGVVFDGSLDGKKLKTPLIVRPGGVITGWLEGMNGKKLGGVYQLTIPSDKAYGAEGNGEEIPANSPLSFIVIPIETLPTIDEPKLEQ